MKSQDVFNSDLVTAPASRRSAKEAMKDKYEVVIFSLFCLLYKLLAGSHMFTST